MKDNKKQWEQLIGDKNKMMDHYKNRIRQSESENDGLRREIKSLKLNKPDISKNEL